jgi:hypothetical protein
VSEGGNFADLGRPRRIWAVASCYGPVERLDRLHIKLAERFTAGDRLVYLGNYLGSLQAAQTLDRLLSFRAYLLTIPGMIANDFVYLRGVQEEIWSKLLQIQLAPNPQEVLRWMLERGGAATLEAYGGNAAEGMAATRGGAVSMVRWTSRLRETMRQHLGHDKLLSVLKRAALTEEEGVGRLLFVHSGIDPTRPLGAQRDSFWWGSGGFERLDCPFETFKRIFRGSDPASRGARLDDYAVTLDAGSGPAGHLIAAAIAPNGEILEIIKG